MGEVVNLKLWKVAERPSIERGEVPVVCQKWEESERGWGTRPDGFSLHVSLDGLKRYIKRYWDGMPDEAPDEYSRPDGTPYVAQVTEEIAAEVREAGDGLRFYSETVPEGGGVDGWRPMSGGGSAR